MNDPTAAIATAGSAGLGAMMLATFGFEPMTLVCAASGAVLGASAAKEAPLWRAALSFAAVIFLAATFGTSIAHAWFNGATWASRLAGGLIGLFFHPFFSAGVEASSEFIRGLSSAIVARVGGGAAKPPGDRPQ